MSLCHCIAAIDPLPLQRKYSVYFCENYDNSARPLSYIVVLLSLMCSLHSRRGYSKSFNVDGLEPWTQYIYRIRFTNRHGDSEWSHGVPFTTISKCALFYFTLFISQQPCLLVCCICTAIFRVNVGRIIVQCEYSQSEDIHIVYAIIR